VENNFNELRKKYPKFIYESFEIDNTTEYITLKYKFTIEGLRCFEPSIKILKEKLNMNEEMIKNSNNIAFHIGLIELISYWKCTCSPNVIIKCGVLNDEQKTWFKKLYYYGLGELFYTNGIKTDIESFMNIECESDKIYEDLKIKTEPQGYLIPIGGGKDSCVTLEALNNKENNLCLIVNPKEVTFACAKVAGYSNEEIVKVERKIDKNLLELNKQGFINGHTPFSSMLAFLSYFIASVLNKKYIALSNESSSNENNVAGEKVNHQYSKSVEFENDFRYYALKYLKRDVEYFSFLRPLNELQIACAFSKFEAYHKIFKSCNQGSKQNPWIWCGDCPKCLFVYIILSPFLYKEKLINIFGKDLFEDARLLKTFIELTGNGETKPFECVGTFEEVCFAITKTIENLENKNEKLPYLLKYYKENYKLSDLSNDLLSMYNEDNNLSLNQSEILKKVIFEND